MDADSTSAKGAYDEMLGAFRRHEADILLGTQMVTKGHDFPDVTLVGVLNADASMFADDYRASEHTFSMLTQVIGRAGFSNREGHEDPELGFVIGVPWQKKGLATEVCTALLQYGKEELGFDRVQMLVMPENRVSLRLAEKLGFHRQDRMTLEGIIHERLLLEL